MSVTMEKVTGYDADVRSYQPSDLLVSNDLVGVEIECEGIGDKTGRLGTLKFWRVTEDGSLRDNGCEFILKSPLSGKDLILALRELPAKLNIGELTPTYNDRTSLHIHIDIRDLTFNQFMNYVITYAAFEKPLFKFAGEHRQGNLFCLSHENAEGDLFKLSEAKNPKDHKVANYVLRRTNKYSACNIASSLRHGSLEFRHHVGTHDTKQILAWINLLLCMKKHAKTMDELPTVEALHRISDIGIEQYMAEVFGTHAEQLMYRDIEHDVMNGIRMAQDIIFRSEMMDNPPARSAKVADEGTPFMKYVKKKHPKKYDGLLGKKGAEPEEFSPEDELVRVLQELGIDVQ